MSEIADAPPVLASWQEVGRSVQGRPIHARTVGFGSRRIYLIGGIHGDEPEGLEAVDPLVRRYVSDRRIALRIVRDMNPDATASGSRVNTRGVDLNRNWPASNFEPGDGRGAFALSEPETSVVYRDVLAFKPDLVVVFHSSTREHAPLVNYDGPAAGLARAWATAASAKGHWRWPVVPSMGYPTPGSIGTFIGVDRQIPILTIEFRRGQDAASVRAAALAGVEHLVREQEAGGDAGLARGPD